MERHLPKSIRALIATGAISVPLLLGQPLPVQAAPIEQKIVQTSSLDQSQQPETHDNILLDIAEVVTLVGISYIALSKLGHEIVNIVTGGKRVREQEAEEKRLKTPVLHRDLDKVKSDVKSTHKAAGKADEKADKAYAKIDEHIKEGSEPKEKGINIKISPESRKRALKLAASAAIVCLGLVYLSGLPQTPSSTPNEGQQPLSPPALNDLSVNKVTPTVFPTPRPTATIAPPKKQTTPRTIIRTIPAPQKLATPIATPIQNPDEVVVPFDFNDPDHRLLAAIMTAPVWATAVLLVLRRRFHKSS